LAAVGCAGPDCHASVRVRLRLAIQLAALAFDRHAAHLNPGDRFLLYTDGVTESENAAGDCFGDIRLEQRVRDNPFRPASELSERLLSEIHLWQPASITQQDDITLIVIDVGLLMTYQKEA
jgi:phosphoserine phosphatase RsbU/P